MEVRARALPSLPAATHCSMVYGTALRNCRYEGRGELGAVKTLSILYKDYHVIHIAVYCGQKGRKIRKKGKKERKKKPNQSKFTQFTHSCVLQVKYKIQLFPASCCTKGKAA